MIFEPEIGDLCGEQFLYICRYFSDETFSLNTVTELIANK